MGKSKFGWLLLVAVILVGVSMLFINSNTQTQENKELFKALKYKQAVSSVHIPDELFFAGERVPIENFDTRESLERELLVNTYWHSQTLLLLKRSKRYFPVIDSILTEYNVPTDFKYLAVAESGLDQVVSPSNAVGFWQFLAGTARDYGLEINDVVDERYHIEKATEAACKYLIESHIKFGSWTNAAASYNRGRRFISNQMERQKQDSYYDLLLGEEGERYVFRILAIKLVFENAHDYGFVVEDDGYKPIPCYNYIVNNSINDFGTFANEQNTNYKILKKLNPWLRESYLTVHGNKTYTIKLPVNGARESLN